MHFIAAGGLVLACPVLAYLLGAYPQWRKWTYFFLGMLPFTIAAWNLDGSIINWAAWPGYAKGAVLTLEDTLAVAIILSQRQPRGLPPLMVWIGLYMAAVALSITLATVPMAPFFYLFQLLRFALVVVAVAKIAVDTRALQWVGMGLAAGVIYEAAISIDQKLHGAFQTSGTMAHPNQLGMMAHFVIMPLLGMLLAGSRSRILMLGVAASLLVAVLAASRATIGFMGFGVMLVLLLSLRRHSTPHKKTMVGLAAAAMVVAAPFLIHSVNNRLAQQYEQRQTGYDEREAFARAARMIWKDHPMGIGANEYVVVVNTMGYSARAGVAWSGNSRGTNVHNTYLLVAAETGWFGLVTYVAMLAAVIVSGWRYSFANRSDPRGDIALGSTIAVAMMALHSRYEWITVTYYVQYVFAISFGIISGLIRVRTLERNQARRDQAALRAATEPIAEQPAVA